jgi:glycosyltransferase involved in cell wall biosynthesis
MTPSGGDPLVSISCLTFNHASFIRECLDGFVAQKTDFRFEVLIHDDASTDGTAEIIGEYQARYPEIIKPVYETENQWQKGRRGSVLFNFPRARGKYIALCEGDDYWTDPDKLQLQVDLLENHSDYALCFHQTREVFEGVEKPDVIHPSEESESGFSVGQLLRNNFILTNSVMYRKQDYSDLAVNLVPADLYLHLFHARFGKIGFIPREMSVYRRHTGGVWWDAEQENQGEIWLKYGVDIMAMWLEVRELFRDEPGYIEIIDQRLREGFEALIQADRVHGGGPVRQFVRRFPDVAADFILSQDQLLDTARQSAALLDVLRSTRVWRTRNVLLRFARPLGLGKKKAEL